MTKVLIADAIKPSLVMSSEIFKDKISGCTVIIALTGEDAIRLAEEEKPDLCLVDFDLPDVDGPALVAALRKIYKGPILMTAYPDKNVQAAVADHLFACNDASAWIPKPVRFDELAARIETFLVERNRTGKRFSTEIESLLIAKAAGRGKRAPKAEGRVINISLGGACIHLEGSMKMKKAQELTLSLTIPSLMKGRGETLGKKLSPTTMKTKKPIAETKIKATVAWVSKDGQIGLKFDRLTDVQQRELEAFLKAESAA